jgi:phosphate transport system permease protein
MARDIELEVRIRRDRAFSGIMIALSLLAVFPLAIILGTIIVRGASSINWRFITALPVPVGESGGGIANAILGTALLIVIATAISLPLGVFGGIFLSEMKQGTGPSSGRSRSITGALGSITRLSIETLMGVPSIVLGIVAYVWVVKPMGHFSALSGGIALAMIMLPVTTLSTEETLLLIPGSLKEAALALGVSYPRMIFKVILPAGMSGIVTGTLLAVARAAGETAPLLFTSFGSPFLTADVTQPMASLPHTIFTYATSPYPQWHDLAWGASFVLMAFVLALNLVTKLVTLKWKIRF